MATSMGGGSQLFVLPERKLINSLNLRTESLNFACEGSQDLARFRIVSAMREHSSESLEDSACGVSSNCGGRLGSVVIEEIGLDTKSHDDIPAFVIGLWAIYTSEATRTELFDPLDEHILPARGV